MLTTIREKTQGWIAGIILGLITIPFALWGVNSYFEGGGRLPVAEASGVEVSTDDFRRALDEQRRSLQQMLGGRYDARILDNPRAKQRIVEQLLDQALAAKDVRDQGYRVGADALAKMIREVPMFMRDGKFDPKVYENLLRSNNLTMAGFEQQQRQDIVMGQREAGLADSVFVTEADVAALLKLAAQRRELESVKFSAREFLGKVAITGDAVQNYYVTHADDYRLPERVRIQYVRLSVAELARSISLTDAELRQIYQDNPARFGTGNQRKAFERVRAEIEQAERTRRAEDRFYEMSERFRNLVYEQPDSLAPAAQALGLKVEETGWFERGQGAGVAAAPRVLEAAFDPELRTHARNSDAIEVSPTDYVAIRVIGYKEPAARPLAEVRADIEKQLRAQLASDKAREVGNALLGTLRTGNASLAVAAREQGGQYVAPRMVTRRELDATLAESVFSAGRPAAGPLFGGTAVDDGYVVYAVRRVEDGDPKAAESQRAQILQQLTDRYGRGLYAAYRAGLREQAGAKIYSDRL